MSDGPGVAWDAVAKAYQDMLLQKSAGTWDASRFGDIPARQGPRPLPDGWHSLSEAFGLIADNMPSPWKDAGNALRRLWFDLQNGDIEAHALDGAGRIVRIPWTLWRHLEDGPGGQHNFALTVAWDCLTGTAFEPDYVGLTPVISAATMLALSVGYTQDEDASAPWLVFPSVSAWLQHPSSTAFAVARIRRSGHWAAPVDERSIRRVLRQTLDAGGYRTPSGEPMSLTSLSAIRRTRR
ncbi:MAG TPA: hypothetical protein VN018_07885 [Brevundimonas sp.]|nr:hypothetical protein [Brevundimonas sp.]